MKVIIGLGNPGKEYEKTRHNVGWMFLDYFADNNNTIISKEKLNCKISEIKINNEKVILAKPLTYMNLSGNAVVKLKNWYKLDDKDIIVIYDDIDIDFGTIRYREKGSGGSHNGMKNIVQMLGTTDIQRIRIGIGGIKHEKQDLKDFVLERFTNNQIDELYNIIFKLVNEKIDTFLDK